MWPKKLPFILIIIVLLGGFLRFYKLDWGEGYFFHPDEYHIAAAVDRLSFPYQMNPHFFPYGTFTIYLIYFSRTFLGIFNSRFLTLNPILIGRFYSAFFSTLTIIIIFLIAKNLFKDKSYSYLSALLVAVMPGLIQQAHFATPESILTFWLLTSLYLGITWFQKDQLKFLYFSAVSLGLTLATKIIALTFLPILVLLPLIKMRLKLLKKPIYPIKLIILPLLIVILTFFLVFPYSLFAWQDFRSSMNYESNVGTGGILVFYTRQFINTPPIIFQFQKILAYTLGPALLLFGILGFLIISIEIIKALFEKQSTIPGLAKAKPRAGSNQRLAIILAFLALFLPNAFLFAKWTRFIAPTFPFFALFTSYFLSKIKNKFLLVTCHLSLVTCFFWTLMFFSIYLRSDVRITATSWLNENLAPGSFILAEAGNMLEVPLSGNLQKKSFDFYHLEENQALQDELLNLLVKADCFIIQSRRIFINHQRLPKQFPRTARFYDLLFLESLGFEKIKEFNSYPKLEIARPRQADPSSTGRGREGKAGENWKLEIPDEVGEETWSVFDHPVIRIYKKVKPLNSQDYESLLQI